MNTANKPPEPFVAFKHKYSLQERRQQYEHTQKKYPNCVLIIAESLKVAHIPPKRIRLIIDKKQFARAIRMNVYHQLQLREQDAVYFFFENKVQLNDWNRTISDLYEKHKDEDGYLYVYFQDQETFGR